MPYKNSARGRYVDAVRRREHTVEKGSGPKDRPMCESSDHYALAANTTNGETVVAPSSWVSG